VAAAEEEEELVAEGEEELVAEGEEELASEVVEENLVFSSPRLVSSSLMEEEGVAEEAEEEVAPS